MENSSPRRTYSRHDDRLFTEDRQSRRNDRDRDRRDRRDDRRSNRPTGEAVNSEGEGDGGTEGNSRRSTERVERGEPEEGEHVPKRRKGRGTFRKRVQRTPTPEIERRDERRSRQASRRHRGGVKSRHYSGRDDRNERYDISKHDDDSGGDIAHSGGASVFDRLGNGDWKRNSREGSEGEERDSGNGTSLASRINVLDRLRLPRNNDDDDDNEPTYYRPSRHNEQRSARSHRRAEDLQSRRLIKLSNPNEASADEPSEFDSLLTGVLEQRVNYTSRPFLEPRPDCQPGGITREDALLTYGTDAWTTEDVFDYWSESNPKFVEWVNDSCVCVIFESPAAAEAARLVQSTAILASEYNEILKLPDEDIVPEDLRLCWRRACDYKNTKEILVRYASTDDVKEVDAWKRSQFYKKQQVSNLDKELDEIATGEYTSERRNEVRKPGAPSSDIRNDRRGRSGGGKMTDAEKQAILDKELEDMMNNDDGDVSIGDATAQADEITEDWGINVAEEELIVDAMDTDIAPMDE
eukprot:CFRG5655T1